MFQSVLLNQLDSFTLSQIDCNIIMTYEYVICWTNLQSENYDYYYYYNLTMFFVIVVHL